MHASPVLREALHDLTDHGLLTRCAGLRPGPLVTPTAAELLIIFGDNPDRIRSEAAFAKLCGAVRSRPRPG